MALWHAAALFAGAVVIEVVTTGPRGLPFAKQAKPLTPAQYVTDEDLIYGAKKAPPPK